MLVDSLNEEAQLNKVGFQMTKRRLAALLVDRLRLRQYQKDNRRSSTRTAGLRVRFRMSQP